MEEAVGNSISFRGANLEGVNLDGAKQWVQYNNSKGQVIFKMVWIRTRRYISNNQSRLVWTNKKIGKRIILDLFNEGLDGFKLVFNVEKSTGETLFSETYVVDSVSKIEKNIKRLQIKYK